MLDNTENDSDDKVFIFGFGPTGQEVAFKLKAAGYTNIHILDLNHTYVERAIMQGFEAHIGDVTHQEVLIHSHIMDAKLIVITVPSQESSIRAIYSCKQLAINAVLVVRSQYQSFKDNLIKAGAI